LEEEICRKYTKRKLLQAQKRLFFANRCKKNHIVPEGHFLSTIQVFLEPGIAYFYSSTIFVILHSQASSNKKKSQNQVA
jgi:hypothetical protein